MRKECRHCGADLTEYDSVGLLNYGTGHFEDDYFVVDVEPLGEINVDVLFCESCGGEV